ncbi:MAG: DUF4296 domain-containing protein [Bacteroidales bacterium]|nr:DUF4296 domain-containing protein [Bacteroidales bacterium]MCI1733358.1 DUF4296 domain-containing protein [Bacteroidales bacterium]
MWSPAVILCAAALSFCISCKSHVKVLDKNKMAEIAGQLYLADQYAKQNPEFYNQADSVLMYKPIFDKYGCTLEQYRSSLKYYMSDNNSYYKILKKAEEILQAQLNQLGGADLAGSSHYSIMDSVIMRGGAYVAANPNLRAQRWIIAQYENYTCNMLDSFCTDIPQNSEWWQNNLKIKKTKNFVMSLPGFNSGSGSAPAASPAASQVFVPQEDMIDNGNANIPASEVKKGREIKNNFMNGASSNGTVDRTLTTGKKLPENGIHKKKMNKKQLEQIKRESKEEQTDGWIH